MADKRLSEKDIMFMFTTFMGAMAGTERKYHTEAEITRPSEERTHIIYELPKPGPKVVCVRDGVNLCHWEVL